MRTEEQKEARRVRIERRARGEYKESAETRAKKSGENSHMWGKTHTDEAKARISKANSGENNHSYGKPAHNKGVPPTEETRAKMSEAHTGIHPTKETKAKLSKANKGVRHTGETKAKMSRAKSGENNYLYGKCVAPEACRKISESVKKTWLDKQWYGTVTYRDSKMYCVLFNEKFKERCRAYWGYKSVLPPHKTQAENSIIRGSPAKLTVHHVYYQPKACCEWDEDLQGYYAMINLGTERKPNIVRHNIKGNPNKFVILTHQEHGEIRADKLSWIKKFEDLIEEQGGKCYYTKEEIKLPSKVKV